VGGGGWVRVGRRWRGVMMMMGMGEGSGDVLIFGMGRSGVCFAQVALDDLLFLDSWMDDVVLLHIYIYSAGRFGKERKKESQHLLVSSERKGCGQRPSCSYLRRALSHWHAIHISAHESRRYADEILILPSIHGGLVSSKN